MNKLIKRTFENRGISDPDIYMNKINNPQHNNLKDIDLLCSHLYDIYDSGKHIVIIPDFDTDGIMSGVIGFSGLSVLNFSVSLFIPNPSDGYGFTADTIKRLISEYPDVDAILTCDVGISCFDGIDYAVKQGIEVLITDHHVQPAVSSNANNFSPSVVIDPMRYDESYEHPQICGAYVLWQCLQRYADLYCTTFDREQIRRLRVFAGIGTVSDSMPLLYENRQLVRDAVNICRLFFTGGSDFVINAVQGNQIYCKAFYGLVAALNLFADMGVISSSDDITESFFGYYLVPMFNSAKRLNGDMSRVFGVFFGSNVLDDVQYLYELNNERKRLVKKELQALLDSNQPYAPYIYISDACAGILGLLATNLMKDSGMPTVVVSKEGKSYKGSGRSPVWYSFLTTVSNEGFYVAGHEHAFGIGLTDIYELESLYAFISKSISDILLSEPDTVSTGYDCDFIIATDGTGDTDIDLFSFAEYLGELDWYRPFGVSFPEPFVKLRFRASEGVWTLLGSMKQHLKISLSYGFEVLCFNQVSYIDMADSDDMITLTGHLGLNEFRGKCTVNFIGTFAKETCI